MKHIILIGFKNSGKTAIGSLLAKQLNRLFIDLDDEIKNLNCKNTGEQKTCREIMEQHGEAHFRNIESEALQKIMQVKKPAVIALGGGAPMQAENRQLLEPHTIIHISAPKAVIFERIMINGKPAFFPQNEEPFESFQRLWEQRTPVFQEIAHISINNKGSLLEAVKEIINQLNL